MKIVGRFDAPVTLDTVLQFGKYKGWTLRDLVECDPSYVIWLVESGAMKIPTEIYKMAEDEDYGNLEQEDDIDWYASEGWKDE